jgi:chromosome segregation ATPase
MVVQIAALDGSLKQLKADSEQVVADISSTYRCHRDLLGDRAEPQTQPELDIVLAEVTGRCAESQRDQQRSAEELASQRGAVAGEEAVISQLTGRKQQLTQRADQLQGKQGQLLDLIGQLNELMNNKVLARSGLDLVSNQATIDEVFEATKRTEEEAKELLVLARANKIFNKRFTKYRQNNNGACPCCAQSMTPTVEKVYEKNIKELFAVSDGGDEQATLEEHKFISAKCASLYAAVKDLHTAMQPLVEVQREIASAEEQVSEHTKTVAELRRHLQAADIAAKEAERTASAFAKLTRELSEANLRWQTVNKRTTEFQEKKRRQSQSLLSVDLGNRSFDDLEQAQRTNNDDKDELQAKKDRLTGEEAALTRRFFTVKSMLSDAEKALSDAKVDGARHGELEAAIAKLQARVQEIEAREETVSRERDQLARELVAQQAVLQEAKAALAKEEEVARSKVAGVKADKDAFGKVVDSLEDVEKRLQQADLADVTRSLEEAQEAIQSREQEVRGLSATITTVTAELASQEHTRRNMLANVELRANVAELHALREDLHARQAQDGGADQVTKLRDAERDLQRIQRQQQTLVSSRDTLRGKLEIYTHQSVDLRAKLNHPTYKGIEERHRRKNIEYETTNLAISDLESYYNAL